MTAFLADEHIQRAIVTGLRARGVEIDTVVDIGLGGAPDKAVWDHCRRENLVLLTNDHHFLQRADEDHPGLVYLTTQFADIGEVVRAVVRWVDTMPQDAFAGRVFYVP